MKARLLVGILVVGMVLVGSSAIARVPAPRVRLHFQTSDTGAAQWQIHRVDAPGDANHSRLKLSVQEQTGNDYAIAYSNTSHIEGVSTPNIRNLSYNFLGTAYQGAGAPRISVEIDETGDGITDVYAYLSGAYCAVPLGIHGWMRADFTGQIAPGCSFYTSEAGSPNYASNGLQSAWATFEDAHSPLDTVVQAYVVMDEVGQSFIDNVAFQARSYNGAARSPGAITRCPTEASC